MRNRVFAGLALLPLAACALDDVGDVETSTTEQGLCTKFGCGTNTAIMGGEPFYMLNLDMATPSPEAHNTIVGFTSATGDALRPMVVGNNFFAFKVADNAAIGGDLLLGAKLKIRNTELTKTFLVTITDRKQSQPYWEDGNDGTTLESWAMSYVEIDKFGVPITRPQPICPNPAVDADGWLTGSRDVLIFRGDVYDPNTGEVTATGADAGTWFNIACAEDVLADLVVTRYTEYTQGTEPMDIYTDVDQRNTALKMWRAVYCGDDVMTVTGTRIDFANAGGWNTLDDGNAPTLANVEAIWKSSGAYCLNHPRRVKLAAVPCANGPHPSVPLCTQDDLDHWQEHGDMITVIPPPP